MRPSRSRSGGRSARARRSARLRARAGADVWRIGQHLAPLRLERENAFVYELGPERKKIRSVDRQNANGGSTHPRSTIENWSVPDEVTFPALPPGMKERHKLFG